MKFTSASMCAKLPLLVVTALLVSSSLVTSRKEKPNKETDSKSPEAQVSKATTRFGFNLMRKLPEDNKNVFFSPISLQILLNMVLLGVDDNSKTQEELVQVLNYHPVGLLHETTNTPAELLRPHEAMKKISQSISAAANKTHDEPKYDGTRRNQRLSRDTTSRRHRKHRKHRKHDRPQYEPVQFTLANSVLVNRNVALNENFEGELKKFYDVKLEQFSIPKGNASELPVHERVNMWVKNKTHNQIENLVQESDLSADTILLLINAAHFKGRWLNPFNPKFTREATFYIFGDEKHTSKVEFMHATDFVFYADFTSGQKDDSGSEESKPKVDSATESSQLEEKRKRLSSKLNCTVLEFPFSVSRGADFSMVFFLPDELDGVLDLQEALDEPTLDEVYSNLHLEKVEIALPKFSFEKKYKNETRQVLEEMGLKRIFEPKTAQLGKMFSTKHEAFVNKIIHKAKINVDEFGAEASAASLAEIGDVSAWEKRPPPSFKADHPFLFVIRHKKSGMTLFLGRVDKLGE